MLNTLRPTFAATLVAIAAVSALADDAGFEARPIAISVARPPADAEALFGPHLNLQRGVTVSVLIASPGPGIVQVDRDASHIERLADSAGNDLLEADADEPVPADAFFAPTFAPIGPFPYIADDGSATIVELRGQSIPAADATAVELEAVLSLRVAEGADTHTIEAVALDGDELEVGDHTIQVGAGDGFWGNGTSVKLTMSAEASEQIAAVRFLDAAGDDLTAQSVGTMTMMGEVEREYLIEQEVSEATLEIDVHTEIRTLEVPIELTLTLGL